MADIIAFEPSAKVISGPELDRLNWLLQHVCGCVALLQGRSQDFAFRVGLELILEKTETLEKLIDGLPEVRP